jgi:hypothetical protein
VISTIDVSYFLGSVFHVDRKENLNGNIFGQPAECFLLELSIIFPEFQRRTTSQSSRRAALPLNSPLEGRRGV